MNYKSLNLKNYDNNGRQEKLPSVLPFYNASEMQKIFDLSSSDRVDTLASHLKVNVDDGESLTICLDDNLFLADLTCGGEDEVRFSNGISPFFMSAVIDAILEMDLEKGERIVLGVPADEGLLISAYVLKQSGFPISKIVVAGESDEEFKDFCLIDVSEEDVFEYIADFYEDFDVLLGSVEAKTSLALDIYTDGFSQKTLLVNAFGYAESLSDCCFALSKKRKSDKDSAKWIAENCALSIPNQKSVRKFTQISKNLMKELCNLA